MVVAGAVRLLHLPVVLLVERAAWAVGAMEVLMVLVLLEQSTLAEEEAVRWLVITMVVVVDLVL
jgi:hypothetical protein